MKDILHGQNYFTKRFDERDLMSSWSLTLLCWRQHKCKGSFATPIATLLHGRIPVNPVRIYVALSWSRRCKAHMRLNVVYALCKTVWGRHWNVFTASHWPDEASIVLSLFPGIHNTKTKLSIYNWSGRLQYLSWWCCPFHKLHSHGCLAFPLLHYKRTHTLAYPNLQTAKHLWEALYDFPGALTFEVPPPLPAFPGAWKIQANLVTHVMSCHAMSHYVILVAKSTYSVIFSSTNKTWLARLVFPPDSDSHSSTDRLLWEIRPTVRGCRYLLCLGVNRKVPKIWKTTSICLF